MRRLRLITTVLAGVALVFAVDLTAGSRYSGGPGTGQLDESEPVPEPNAEVPTIRSRMMRKYIKTEMGR